MKLPRKLPLWLLVIPILFISTGLVMSQLGVDSLDDDEKNSVKHLVNFGQRFTLSETIDSVKRTSPEHVPGFHLQLSIWAEFVGLHFVSLRALSLFYFALSVAMMYRLANDILSSRHGVIAAFIVALSGFYMHYGHEIRMYAPVVFQTIVILWIYWRIMVSRKPTHWHHYVILLVFSIFGVYTHNLVFFPLLAIGFYHLLFAPKTRQWGIVVGVEIMAGIAFLPWIPNVLNGVSGFEDLTDTVQSAPELLFNSLFIYTNGFWVAGLILLVLAIWKLSRKDFNLKYIIVITLVMVVGMILFNEAFSYIPSRRMRYTLIWFPSLAILMSYGIYVLAGYSRYLMWGVLAIWGGMLIWFSGSPEQLHFVNLQRSQFYEWFPIHVVGETIKNDYDPWLGQDTPLVFFDSQFEYQPMLVNYYEEIYHKKIEYLSYPISDQHLDRLKKIDNSFPGFWFSYRAADAVNVLAWQDESQIRALFDKYAMCLVAIDREDVYLAYYLDSRLPCSLIKGFESQSINFNNGYTLQQSVVDYEDASVEVSLFWHSDDLNFDGSYGFSLQVFRDGEKVGQTDYPIDNLVTQNRVNLPDIEAGIYKVNLIAYSSADAKSIGGQWVNGNQFEREVEIGQFEVIGVSS